MVERLEQIEQEILKLKNEKNTILKHFSEKLSFSERLKYWLKFADKEHSGYIPDKGDFPNLRQELENSHLDRYQTVDIFSFFEDEIYELTEEDGNPDNVSETTKSAIEECMTENLGSFTYDW